MAESIAFKKQIEFVAVFKAIACLLILNSHCRDIYPIMFLAVGGGYGNALFFALSGFCLVNIQQSFFQWYWKRIRRILPVSLLVMIVGVIAVNAQQGGVMSAYDVLKYSLNQYWFVWAILLYYIIYYFVFRYKPQKYGMTILMEHFIGYIILYIFTVNRQAFSVELEGFSPFKVYFYFGIFVCGGLLRIYSNYIKEFCNRKMLLILTVIGVLSILLWCVEYALIMVWNMALEFQCLIQVSVFIFSVVAVMLGVCLEHRIKIPKGAKGYIIKALSDCTLEIYLVQVTFKNYIVDWPFPCNWLVFIIGSIVMGMIFHNMSRIRKLIKPTCDEV